MGTRITAAALVAGAALLLAASGAGAALIGLYRNDMETEAQRAEIVKQAGERCRRGGSTHTLQVVVGKQTRECAYRTPVLGRDLEIAATERLLASTPGPAQHGAFLAVNLRVGEAGPGYQLAVYPLQGKVQLRKTLADGRVKYLSIVKEVGAVQGVGKANELRLRAFNITSGPERGHALVLAYVGGEKVAEVNDEAAAELQGRESGVSVGAASKAKGIAASIDNVVVRIPNPFQARPAGPPPPAPAPAH